MSSERADRDDAADGGTEGEGSGTHGGIAIGRTTGMGAGIADGGTPGPDEASDGESGGTADD